MLNALLEKIKKPKQSGIECTYCGWRGTSDQIFKAQVLNTDGSPYRIDTCPICLRNGGLIDHDAPLPE